MHRNRPTRAPFVVVAALAAILTAGCDRFYVVSGKVQSCADAHTPIEGATVGVELPVAHKRGFVKTGPDGAFTVWLNEPSDDDDVREADVEVQKPSYRAAHAKARPTKPVEVCLDPLPAR